LSPPTITPSLPQASSISVHTELMLRTSDSANWQTLKKKHCARYKFLYCIVYSCGEGLSPPDWQSGLEMAFK